MSDDNQPCKVPLLEQLRSVPIGARDCLQVGECAHRFIPYGALCHRAAREIERLKRDLAEACANVDRWSRLARTNARAGNATEDERFRLFEENKALRAQLNREGT